jgi:hypothetical protein
MNTAIGLRERIAHAENETEVIQLLASGNDLQYASPRTRLSWKHTAQRRIRQLQKAETIANTPEKSPVSNKKKTGSKKITSKK